MRSDGPRVSAASRLADRLTSVVGFHVFVTGLLVALALMRGHLFSGTGGDDGEQLVFAQSFEWGYQPRNPPLFTWAVIAVQPLLGPTAMAVAAVKFACLWLLYVLLYQCGRVVFLDGRFAALAALAPLAIYHVGWDAVLGYSHSVLAAMLYVATFAVVLGLDRRGGLGGYVALGLVLGLGLLAKFAYALFFVSLIAAALMDPELRRKLARPQALVALVVAAAVVAPHALWLHGHAGEIASDPPGDPWRGLGHVANAAVGFVLPLALVLLALFPRAALPVKERFAPSERYRRLIGRQLAIVLALVVVVVLVSGFRVRTHYMFVLILFPLWALARVQAAGAGEGALRGFAAAAAAFGVGFAVALPVKAVAEPHWCEDCELHLDYAAYARQLRDAGFRGGTIVADWHPYPLAGNVRIQFPEARVVDVKHPGVRPPPRAFGDQCLLIWAETPSGARRGAVTSVAERHLGVDVAADAEIGTLAAPITGNPAHVVRFGYRLSSGVGDCR